MACSQREMDWCSFFLILIRCLETSSPPPFSYDVDDPCIDVNVVFPDVDQCKSAVIHHAILNDHAYQIVKKDRRRFRAICKRAKEGCNWKFFASTSKKYLGCKVNSTFCFDLQQV